KTLLFAVMLSSASTASAGFFDSIFGKKEAAPVAQTTMTNEVAKAASEEVPAEASETGSMVDMAMGLLPTLTQGLGVSSDQAEGGMGALLKLAQTTLSGDEFGSLSEGIPGIEGMLAAAPSLGDSSGAGLGGILSKVSGASGSLGALGEVTKQFEALGLSPDMVLKFAQMAIEYFSGDSKSSDEQGSGIDIGGLLQKGLGA
ncbi:hypothetical protein A3741_27600, partial [Oleiphilus sp. HI0069]